MAVGRGRCDLLAGPALVFERAGFVFVLQAAAVKAAILTLTVTTRVIGQSTEATGLTVFPCLEGKIAEPKVNPWRFPCISILTKKKIIRTWFHTFLTC